MSERSLTALLTADCNLRCRYCHQRRKRRGRASWPELQEAVRFMLLTAGDLHISITGGEPLVAFSDLVDLVSHVENKAGRARTIRWSLTTNGLLLDDEKAAFLERHRFEVTLSFDGVPPAQAIRGRGTFCHLDRLLDRLRARHRQLFARRLGINVILSPPSVRHFSRSMRYFLEKGVRTVDVFPVMGQAGWQVERVDRLEEEFERVFDLSLDHYDRTRQVPLTLFRKTRSGTRRRVSAGSAWMCQAASGSNLAVDVDGQVYGCTLATDSYCVNPPAVMRPALDALRLGRPTDPGFRARVTGMKAAARACGAFQHPEARYSSYGKCVECRYFGRCVPCPLAPAAEREWDDIRRVPDFTCAFNQVSLAYRDRFPAQPTVYELLTARTPGARRAPTAQSPKPKA